MRFILALLVVFFTANAFAATRLGLHVTQEEVYCWRQRAGIDIQGANGITCPVKYVKAGDVQTNSPGDWTDITTRKTQFNSAPTTDRWPGNTTASCWTSASPGPNPALQIKMEAAAFYALVANDSASATNVAAELYWHATQPGLDFSNSIKWCYGAPNFYASDTNPFFDTAGNLTRMLFAWDYIDAGQTKWGWSTSVISVAQRTAINTWFTNMLVFWSGTIDSHRESRFTDRYNVNFDTGHQLSAYSLTLTGCTTQLWYGSPTIQCLHENWNNRMSAMFFLFSMIAIRNNDATQIGRAKLYVKEDIVFGHETGGSFHDFYRALEGTNPDLGWSYSMGPTAQDLAVADTLARRGDTELFNWSSNKYLSWDGKAFSIQTGGTKTLQSIMQAHLNYVDHTLLRYGNATLNDVNHEIDSLDQMNNVGYVNDVWLAFANNYFQSAYFKSIYLRTAPGQNGYTTPGYPIAGIIAGSNTNPWGGPNGLYPANLFMFGQMEGVVNPYIAGSTLADITWINNRGGSGNATGTNANWQADVLLKSGINNITVTATDGTNVGTATRSIIYAPTFPGNTLAGAWGFNEASGTTITDSSDNNNNGLLFNGATRGAGPKASAIILDGATQYAEINPTSSLAVTQSFTVSGWAKPTITHTDFRAVASNNGYIYLYASTPTQDCGNGGPMIYLVLNGGGLANPQQGVCYPVSTQPTQWTHLAFSYDGAVGSTGKLRIYANGVLQASKDLTGYMEPVGGAFTIGKSEYGEYFQGGLAEMRFYNYAIPLTAGLNQTPSLACGYADYTAAVKASNYTLASVVGDMNCSVIPTTPPIYVLKLPAAASALKLSPAAGILKLGPGQ